jgi:hypothetical protein
MRGRHARVRAEPSGRVRNCGSAATEPHRFIASPEGVRRWLIYSFNARGRVHSLQPVLRPNGFCSKAFRACPFRCIAPPAGKCTNGCRRTHRSGPHEYRAFRHCRVVVEPRLECGNPRSGETDSARARPAIRIGKTACSSERSGGLAVANYRARTARQRRSQRNRDP